MAKFEYLYIFLSVFATSANLEGQKFSQIRRENSAISLVEIFTWQLSNLLWALVIVYF